MVEKVIGVEKKSDNAADWLLVVAGVLIDCEGRWLLHQRPCGKMYAGLWEFPGGKVEASEFPTDSLVRELSEELGIEVLPEACLPASFAQDGPRAQRPAIVLMLYTICAWQGEPQPLEGGRIGWFSPQQALQLAMPPMDQELAKRLAGYWGENRV